MKEPRTNERTARPRALRFNRAEMAGALGDLGVYIPLLAGKVNRSGLQFGLAVTGLIDWLNRTIPKSVVRGLQLALGLKLLTKGVGMVAGTGVLFGWDSIGLGVVCVLLVLLLQEQGL